MILVISADGLAEDLAALQRLDSLAPLAPFVEAGADLLINSARTYPPELPGQRYARTGNLGAGWERQPASVGPRLISVDVYNLVEYGPKVQGDDDQEAPFTGRWRTESQILEDATDQIEGMIADGLDALTGGIL